LRGRLRSLRRERRSLEEALGTGSRSLPADPVRFCREWLFFEPYGYMWPFLRDGGHFVAVLQARQTGKTFNGMAKLLYLAFRYPGSTMLVTAPKLGQVKGVAFKHGDGIGPGLGPDLHTVHQRFHWQAFIQAVL